MWRFDTGGTKATLGRGRNGKHYLSVFSAYLSAAAILCGRFSSLPEILEAKRNQQETRNFENLKRATKNGHTVWPPPINRRRKRTISGKIVVPFVVRAPSVCGGCFGVGGCCVVVAMCARAGGPASRPTAAGFFFHARREFRARRRCPVVSGGRSVRIGRKRREISLSYTPS